MSIRGDIINEKGINLLRNPFLNRGQEFTRNERKTFGILGLLPTSVKTIEDQTKLFLHRLDLKTSDFDKYLFLMDLLSLDTDLFFHIVCKNIECIMPLIYTPTVGLACQNYPLTMSRPQGLFISAEDEHSIITILRNWPMKEVSVIVVTDGERVLGLGDLGANGMGISVGKLALYTALAGINPALCLPITLDVGTNNKALLNDSFYIGLRQPRLKEDQYDVFIDRFIKSCSQVFGPHVLIQFEDFGNANAFRLLTKYRNQVCCYNDDIQGTAAVAVAAILSALKITKTDLTANKFLFMGAGEASLGIGMLLLQALVRKGLTDLEAKSQIYMTDSQGLIVENHPTRKVTGPKTLFMKSMAHISDFAEIVDTIKPTVLVGAASLPGSFTPEILEKMAEFNERPVIFALSNPTSKAECSAAECYRYTRGACLFASGSPFPRSQYDGVEYDTSQANNAYIFPAMGLAIVAAQIRPITEDLFLEAAEVLSEQVTEGDVALGRILPPLEKIREVSRTIAIRVAELAYKRNLAWRPLSTAVCVENLIRLHTYNPIRKKLV